MQCVYTQQKLHKQFPYCTLMKWLSSRLLLLLLLSLSDSFSFVYTIHIIYLSVYLRAYLYNLHFSPKLHLYVETGSGIRCNHDVFITFNRIDWKIFLFVGDFFIRISHFSIVATQKNAVKSEKNVLNWMNCTKTESMNRLKKCESSSEIHSHYLHPYVNSVMQNRMGKKNKSKLSTHTNISFFYISYLYLYHCMCEWAQSSFGPHSW